MSQQKYACCLAVAMLVRALHDELWICIHGYPAAPCYYIYDALFHANDV
jgi:hypothetical protein